MRPTSVTVSATGNSDWIPIDYTQNNFNLGIQVTVSDGASLTWVVQMTSDDVFDPSVTPVAITAPDPLNTGTGNEIGSITTPVRAVRLNATVTSGTATMTVIQGRKVGPPGGTLVTWNDDATALLTPDGSALFAAPRTVVVAAGTPTPDIETAISRASAMSPAYDAPVQIVLPPGTYALAASTLWPSWVSLRGAGQKLTRIIATNTNNLRIGTGGTFEDFTVEGTATGATVGLIRHSGAYVRDCIVRNVDVWHESTSGQALYFDNYVHSMRWENVNIWTKSIAAKMRGMQWMYGCTFGIAGDATGTPYVALDVVGAGYLQLHNCMIGNGYNYTTRTGWPDGMIITNDSTAPAYGVRIASGTPGTPRVNLFNCYSFINHLTRAANDVNCVLAEAAGYVRLYGGIYQAEANSFESPTLVQSGSGVIEQYATRFSRQSGEIRGYAGYAGLQAKTASFTVDENGPDGVILCDASSGPITVTLPNPSATPSARRGAVRRVKKIDASANAVTLSCAAGIDGATTLVLGSQWDTAKVVLGATQWYVMP